jgi:hypothetical protein
MRKVEARKEKLKMKVKVVQAASQKLVDRVDAYRITKSHGKSVSPITIKALRREKCTDADEVEFNAIREAHLTAGTIKNFIPKSVIGAETNSKRRSDAHKCLQSKAERKRQQNSLRYNPYCIHGRTYQLEAASVYSKLTGATLVAIGCIVGPIEAEGEFPAVPSYISGTLDYIDLHTGTIVEIKCPQRIHKNWKQLYWVQGQVQMQLARAHTLHVFQYVPPMRDVRGQCQMNIMTVNHDWFRRIQKSLREKAQMLPSKFSVDQDTTISQ